MVRKTVLDNGCRVITETLPHMVSVSLGIWVANGSRDEGQENSGISHFIEHMIFKGTRRRSAQQIALELDAIGGLSNAFTSKEQTCFHTKVLKDHLPRAADLLLDIFTASVFDPVELDRERQVVLQEISMVEDTPDEYTHVLYGETVYERNSLGQPILGSPETVQSFSQETLLQYLQEAYGAEKVVVTAAGKVDHDALLALLRPELEKLPSSRAPSHRQKPELRARLRVVPKDLEQVHLALGTWAPAAPDETRYAATLLNALVGGNMSSRLFQEVREKRGLAYTIYSYLSAFEDTGLWGIYTAVARETLAETLEVIGQELVKIKRGDLDRGELEAAREFVRGGVLLGEENNENRMTRLAQNEIHFGRHLTSEEILAGLQRTTLDEVTALADQCLQPGTFSLVAFGPIQESELPSPWMRWS
ncbi:MAG: insulinase family protein [Desulfobacterota bacterium]|nr:insulinase family protein [Thermodesulfobacteriota bacterium]